MVVILQSNFMHSELVMGVYVWYEMSFGISQAT